MQTGLYIAGSLLVAFIVFKFVFRIANRYGLSAAVSEYPRFIRAFVRAGYPGIKLYFKHKETGRVIKLIKPRSPFYFSGELSVELTAVIPPAYRPDQVDSIWKILQQYELQAEVIRPGELFARCPIDEELLSGLVRSILTEGFELGFTTRLRVSLFGPVSGVELIQCNQCK
jgi:hypothetical protein